MRFARWTFRIAAVYGFVVTVPMFFLESQVTPRPNHPEQYYGFLGLILAWQIAFWIIGGDPVRYRALMIVAVIEKAAFAVPCAILFALGRVRGDVLTLGTIDAVLGVLFAMAFAKTRVRE
jgi:hypothetical protein